MKQKLLGTALASLLLAAPLAHSAEFICQDDVKPASYSPEEQRLVDQFWEESLTYLGQYLRALETPTGECPDSAEATIQTYDAAAGAKQTRCIMRYRDIELLAKHLRAVQAEPDKAKKCFDPQKNYGAFPLYTPSAEVQALSAVCRSRAATRPWTACTAC